MVAQIVVREPVVPQQAFPFNLVIKSLAVIEREQVAHKSQVVWESLMGKLVEAQVELRWHSSDVAKVRLQVTAGKYLQYLLREPLQVLRALLRQVPAGQLVIPVRPWKLLDRALVHRFFFRAKPVAFQKSGKLFIKSGVVGISVQLLPPDRERRGDLLK